MQGYIASIIPMSTDFWEGNVCSVINFAGCDFRCQYCYASQMLSFKEEFLRDLREVREEIQLNCSFIDGVVFSGGEPCLQMQTLLNLARFCKDLSLKVCVDTNGTKVNVLKAMIREGLLDYVILDIKSPFLVATFDKVTKSKTYFKDTRKVMDAIEDTLEFLRTNDIEYSIKTVIVPELFSDREQIMAIAETIHDLECRWYLQGFRLDKGPIVNKNLTKGTNELTLYSIRDYCLKKFPRMQIEVKV